MVKNQYVMKYSCIIKKVITYEAFVEFSEAGPDEAKEFAFDLARHLEEFGSDCPFVVFRTAEISVKQAVTPEKNPAP